MHEEISIWRSGDCVGICESFPRGCGSWVVGVGATFLSDDEEMIPVAVLRVDLLVVIVFVD